MTSRARLSLALAYSVLFGFVEWLQLCCQIRRSLGNRALRHGFRRCAARRGGPNTFVFSHSYAFAPNSSAGLAETPSRKPTRSNFLRIAPKSAQGKSILVQHASFEVSRCSKFTSNPLRQFETARRLPIHILRLAFHRFARTQCV